jgi:hypothetical protein
MFRQLAQAIVKMEIGPSDSLALNSIFFYDLTLFL